MRLRGPTRSGAFADDVVVVTGASGGIGREVARRFAEGGARVGMLGRDLDALRAVADALPAGSTHVAGADVADERQVAVAVADVEATLGPVTVLVNNAGHGHWGAVVDTDSDTFRRAIEVNYLGTVHATAQVLEGMLRRGHGHIVNVASIAGRIGAPFEAAYSASKFAVVGYSEALAVELAGSGVTVSLVEPGPVATGFFERRGRPVAGGWPRPMPPDRVARSIVAAVRRGDRERFLPVSLGVAHAVKTVAPPVYRLGVRRRFRTDRRDLHRRYR